MLSVNRDMLRKILSKMIMLMLMLMLMLHLVMLLHLLDTGFVPLGPLFHSSCRDDPRVHRLECLDRHATLDDFPRVSCRAHLLHHLQNPPRLVPTRVRTQVSALPECHMTSDVIACKGSLVGVGARVGLEVRLGAKSAPAAVHVAPERAHALVQHALVAAQLAWLTEGAAAGWVRAGMRALTAVDPGMMHEGGGMGKGFGAGGAAEGALAGVRQAVAGEIAAARKGAGAAVDAAHVSRCRRIS